MARTTPAQKPLGAALMMRSLGLEDVVIAPLLDSAGKGGWFETNRAIMGGYVKPEEQENQVSGISACWRGAAIIEKYSKKQFSPDCPAFALRTTCTRPRFLAGCATNRTVMLSYRPKLTHAWNRNAHIALRLCAHFSCRRTNSKRFHAAAYDTKTDA